MAAYYNEIDPFAAAWLRNLIRAGLIARGEVDTRSITEVQPDDVGGFTQCHFFAGVGVWSHAARHAGVADHDSLWTGSCPCQPFSAAGKQRGTDDERHLWPEFLRLIADCRPPIVLGEQVASALGRAWLGSVRLDLEALGYGVGAADLCAAGSGAPHIRQRLFWVADAMPAGRAEGRASAGHGPAAGGGLAGDVADAAEPGRSAFPQRDAGEDRGQAAQPGRLRDAGAVGRQRATAQRDGQAGGVADADGRHAGEAWAGWLQRGGQYGQQQEDGGALRGFWSHAEWIACRDGKARPVEPGTFPLAHGIAGRVGRLRAYGNAICAPIAREFIAAVMECRP